MSDWNQDWPNSDDNVKNLYKRLKDLLHYNPETGIFTWLQSTNRKIKLGDIAGCKNHKGYIRIRFDGKYYQAHRLAFLYMTGEWPEEFIDHKNGITSDNRWKNLRDATRQQNAYNRSHEFDNKLGVKGVHMHQGKYLAQICIDGQPKYLGLYKTLEEASEAYQSVAENIQGEFAYQMRNEEC